MERKIAVIGGTGAQGFGLALRFAKTGESVIIGSRQKQKAEEAAGRIKAMLGSAARVQGMENAEAAERSNLLILAVPFSAQIEILKSIKGKLKEGDTLIDVTVPLASDIGGKATRTLGIWEGSAAQQAAGLIPKQVRIVSAFHNVSAESLQDVHSQIDCDILVCGDDPDAKVVAKELIEKIPGARYINGGPLENSRIVEQLTALLISININYKVHRAGIRITGI